MYKILIVEDDIVIAETVKKHIESWGFEAECIKDFGNVFEEFVRYNPQLVLMDLSLPFYNGYYWCEKIRTVSKTPVIFVSSASDNMNIIMAMNMGGDDFVSKPFELSVLTAKIQAMLRRTYDFASSSNLIECHGAILNLSDDTLSYNDKFLDLTKNEFKILRLLMESKGKIVSREAIMTLLWESDSFVDENTLTVNVTRLRKKLDGAGLKDLIKTKKGSGYIIEQ